MTEEYDDLEDLMPGKRRSILADLDEITSEDDGFSLSDNNSNYEASPFLASSLLKQNKEDVTNHKNIEEEDDDNDEIDSWMSSLQSIAVNVRPGKGYKKKGNPFDFDKKKKKKKKKPGEPTDFAKEFEPEQVFLKNLLRDQNAFNENLQKTYDSLTSRKSSNRGMTKTLTELINSITSGRNTSAQLVTKLIDLKKTIHDLTMKERKELGAALGLDGEDISSDYAAQIIRKLSNARGQILDPSIGGNINEYDDPDDMFDDIESTVADVLASRHDDVEKYMEYENLKPVIYACVNQHDHNDVYFEAISEVTGENIPDYPLPDKTSLTFNESTNYAIDPSGTKYRIHWV